MQTSFVIQSNQRGLIEIGMTIVEAAAFGVPTLMHEDASAIGAKDLLPAEARFEANMNDVTTASGVLAGLVR